jgi:phenylpropionate dioxygenase-like ring-hydroxylating dioxygenase large terminal subunit
VARLGDFWFVVAESRELAAGSLLPFTLLGVPIVIFRSQSGELGAFLDRCPHRNVPLSEGQVLGENLQCRYHGWQFDTEGRCRLVPGLEEGKVGRAHAATALAVRESQGYVWVYGAPGKEPATEPFAIPHLDDDRYAHTRRQVEARGSLHAVIENALDVPHTSFLHRGLFRGVGQRNAIEAVVRRWENRCEARYLGEPRPSGLLARLLAPGSGEVVHTDRFWLPSIAQVDYALGEHTHLCITTLCTPIDDFRTRLFAVVSHRLRLLPAWAVKAVLVPLGHRVFAQDARILESQTETIRRFGGEEYASTEIDLLGPQIWHLMRDAERDGPPAGASADPVYERTVRLTV